MTKNIFHGQLRNFLENIKPHKNYEQGGVIFDFSYRKSGEVTPAKALAYRIDPVTHQIIEVIKPRTHEFENILRATFKELLKQNKKFPTNKDVFVLIEHGLHAVHDFEACDVDNRAKTILDALKSAVYQDDRQVSVLWTCKKFLRYQQESYFAISICVLNVVKRQRIMRMMRCV